MSNNLEFIGFESKRCEALKESISNYLTVKNIEYNIVGVHDENQSKLAEAGKEYVKFNDHLIYFPIDQDIKIGLSNLHHLIHESGHDNKKTCLNCANCKCKK